MFDFDNDGDFDLDDIVQVDIKYGFFKQGECPQCGEFIGNSNIGICPFCGHKFKVSY